MQFKLSLIAIFGIISLASSQDFTDENCKALEKDVAVHTVCNNCSSMSLYVCGDSLTTYIVPCTEGTYCTQTEGEAAKCGEQSECDGCIVPTPPEPTPSLLCTGSGFYPDPFDCTGFHYCTEYGQPSQFQPCPADYSFDPDFKLAPCKKTVNEEVDCLKVDCSESSVFKRYGTSRRFYAYCKKDDATNVSMFKCADGTNFDGSRCVFQCPGEGNFANTLNDSIYYQCYYSGEVLVNRLLPCPGSRKFNETMQVCL